ncbi:mucin-2 [Achroia grisella]|uniref:mucin-2 n=1 Tax=Achroia grisella TaxID=688607 RepID=UPI0027D31801|nr:mucin-2 [Achroia grisella]
MGNFRWRLSDTILNFLKMDIGTCLSLLIAVITLATPAQSSEPRVVCYYTNWSVYRPGTAKFNPQNINPYLCTHLIYAFGAFTKENTLKPFDKYQDIEKGGYAKFVGLKTYNKNLKTLLAIGGWNEGSTRFSPMVASRERRKEFVRNAIKFLRQNRFDGLDLDWEYPAFRDGGKPKDRDNYAKLVKELREEFEKESEKTGKPRLLLTMAVPAGIEYIQKGFDVKTLNRYLDWMNLLSYDYHSAFEPAVNHHAPLFPLEEPNEYSTDNELNIDYTIKFYIENGADADKLVLGIPTYGRSYTLFNPDAVEIGSPADGPGEQGDATREKGYLAYYEICEALKPKENKRSVRQSDDDDDDDDDDDSGESSEVDVPWTVMYPNPNAMGPVAFKGNQWVGYDDVEIVKKKAEYVADNGLGGIMFWSIDNDDFRGTCHNKPYPLIEAAKEAYISKLGATDNAIISQPVTKASTNRRNRPRVTTTTTTTTAKPSAAAKTLSSKRKSGSSYTSTTPAWNANTPEPPTTPDPGADFKCKDEGFFPHPRDCKKYFWCLDSGPSNLGIVAHQFTCPSGLFFNKAADSCDFARNVLCKKPSATTKATTKAASTTSSTTTTTTRRPIKLSTKNSVLFRTTTTTTTPEPESEEEIEEEVPEDTSDVDAEDPKVIKELIDLIKKVGGVEQLEKHLRLSETLVSTDGPSTTPTSLNKKLYKVLERTRGKNKFNLNTASEGSSSQNSRRGPQNAGLESSADKSAQTKKDRPQYITINRSRATTASTEASVASEEATEKPFVSNFKQSRSRVVESTDNGGTTSRTLQYVNIRRAPSPSTSDTADDTASRNALFERVEPYIEVSETPSTLDIRNARRENMPEYVTIRRQRPTTEETTTSRYLSSERNNESQGQALEREISSQPQYTSIVRARSTTLPPPDDYKNPEPTTILAVQISSLLNSPSPTEAEVLETETEAPPTEETEATTVSSTTTTTTTPSTTTTTTTSLPLILSSSIAPRPLPIRRRGSTTITPFTTIQSLKERRNQLLRRNKATSSPDATESNTDPVSTDATTTKYTRRTKSKFKYQSSRKEENADEDQRQIEQRPSLNGGARRSELPKRNYSRRRPGGANASVATSSQRPFRVGRRRPGTTSTTTSTSTSRTSTSTASTNTSTQLIDLEPDDEEEVLQDVDENDYNDESTQPRITQKSASKVQRRPLLTLKEEAGDQNPSATNEEENKRHSKKYNNSSKKNRLVQALKDLENDEVYETTERRTTVDIEDISPETAVAIAAHQLLAAPIPVIPNYDEDTQPHIKTSPKTITEYDFTSPEYTETYTESRKTVYSDDYLSTTVLPTRDNVHTSTGPEYSVTAIEFEAPKLSRTTSFAPITTYSTNAFTTKLPQQLINSEPTITHVGLTGTRFPLGKTKTTSEYTTKYVDTTEYSDPTITPSTNFAIPKSTFRTSYVKNSRTSGITQPTSSDLPSTSAVPKSLNGNQRTRQFSNQGGTGESLTISTPTARYLGSNPKLIPVPVEDYAFSTDGYTGLSQEPAYFTREYLLESPVTKAYDDEYQYLSPVTTQQSIPRKLQRKKIYRKISTTQPPTTEAFVPVVTTAKPRRVQSTAKPFSKVQKTVPNRTYRPILNYDYYDDSEEKVAEKYVEGTKVVLHAKGTIECLDIGNFPHPTSCKKFISCARMESGSLLGWEYVCPKGLSFDPVGGICNWSAGLGCAEKDA